MGIAELSTTLRHTRLPIRSAVFVRQSQASATERFALPCADKRHDCVRLIAADGGPKPQTEIDTRPGLASGSDGNSSSMVLPPTSQSPSSTRGNSSILDLEQESVDREQDLDCLGVYAMDLNSPPTGI